MVLSELGTELSFKAAKEAYVGMTDTVTKGIVGNDKDSAQAFGIAAIIIGLLQFCIACLHAGFVLALVKFGGQLGAVCFNGNKADKPILRVSSSKKQSYHTETKKSQSRKKHRQTQLDTEKHHKAKEHKPKKHHRKHHKRHHRGKNVN